VGAFIHIITCINFLDCISWLLFKVFAIKKPGLMIRVSLTKQKISG